MKDYSAREVATMLGVSVARVRSFAAAGLVEPASGARGEQRYSFQDLVLLRAAKELSEARIPITSIRRSLEQLRQQLPEHRPISAIRIAADGRRVVARDGEHAWHPDSGQTLFDFSAATEDRNVAAFTIRPQDEDPQAADDWYESAFALETSSLDEAEEAYRRTLELDSEHIDAHVNLGRILHERHELADAEAHYRAALALLPEHPVALFNLGVVLEDQGRRSEALDAYRGAIAADPDFADAHFNLAGLYEELGRPLDAFRHLKAYRKSRV